VESLQLGQEDVAVKRQCLGALMIRKHDPVKIPVDEGRTASFELVRFENDLTIKRNDVRVFVMTVEIHFACISRQTQPDFQTSLLLKVGVHQEIFVEDGLKVT